MIAFVGGVKPNPDVKNFVAINMKYINKATINGHIPNQQVKLNQAFSFTVPKDSFTFADIFTMQIRQKGETAYTVLGGNDPSNNDGSPIPNDPIKKEYSKWLGYDLNTNVGVGETPIQTLTISKE